MTDRDRRKDPPASAIQCGYWLTMARKKFEDASHCLKKAEEYALEAREELTADGTAYFMEFAPIMQGIYNAMAAMHAPGAAHEIAREFMKEKGFRDITNRDFATYGSGGGR
jgi:hypothetical protein